MFVEAGFFRCRILSSTFYDLPNRITEFSCVGCIHSLVSDRLVTSAVSWACQFDYFLDNVYQALDPNRCVLTSVLQNRIDFEVSVGFYDTLKSYILERHFKFFVELLHALTETLLLVSTLGSGMYLLTKRQTNPYNGGRFDFSNNGPRPTPHN